jgi:hypothetical protein
LYSFKDCNSLADVVDARVTTGTFDNPLPCHTILARLHRRRRLYQTMLSFFILPHEGRSLQASKLHPLSLSMNRFIAITKLLPVTK